MSLAALDSNSETGSPIQATVWALFISLPWFLLAVLRPTNLGHDTKQYIDSLIDYFSPWGLRFPDLVFHSLAIFVTTISAQLNGDKYLTARLFLALVAGLQWILWFVVLRRRRAVDALVLALGFSPLIFIDIIRQGLAMLFAAAFFAAQSTRAWPLLFLSLSTHIAAAGAGLLLLVRKANIKYIAVFAPFAVILAYVFWDQYADKLAYFLRNEDLRNLENPLDFDFSYLNLLVLCFLVYSMANRFMSLAEGSCWMVLYIFSIWNPVFFRFYLFFVFCLSCSRDMLVNSWSVKALIYNFGYAAVVLRMSLNAFDV